MVRYIPIIIGCALISVGVYQAIQPRCQVAPGRVLELPGASGNNCVVVKGRKGINGNGDGGDAILCGGTAN